MQLLGASFIAGLAFSGFLASSLVLVCSHGHCKFVSRPSCGVSSFAVECNFVNLSDLEVRGLRGMVTLDHLLLPELPGRLSLKALCF